MTCPRTLAPALGLGLAALGLLALTVPARADVSINGTDTGDTSITLDSSEYLGQTVTEAATNASQDSLTLAPGSVIAASNRYADNYAVSAVGGTVTLSGGSLTAQMGGGSVNNGIEVGGGTVDILSGSVTASGGDSSANDGVEVTRGSVTIYGGAISASGGDESYNYAVSTSGGTVDISGGTFTVSASPADVSSDLAVTSGGIINLYGQFYTDGTYTTLYTGTDPTLNNTSTIYAQLADGGPDQALSYTLGGGTINLIDTPIAPEPSEIGMIALIGLGLGGLVLRARRRSNAA